jgi:hypothetical protein
MRLREQPIRVFGYDGRRRIGRTSGDGRQLLHVFVGFLDIFGLLPALAPLP